MASLNKVILIGHLGRDPEVKSSKGGVSVGRLSIATSERVKRGEEYVEETEWHRVTCFGKLADNAGKYLSKGRMVYVEGRIQTRKYKGQDGTDKWATEIVAHEIKFLGGSSGRQDERREERREEPADDFAGGYGNHGPVGGVGGDDDIPF